MHEAAQQLGRLTVMRSETMKTQYASIGHSGTVRAGVISLLVLALCYQWMTQRWDLPHTWLFIISFAVCFVLMMGAIVELLVLTFNFAARFSGWGVGRSVRLVRRSVRLIRRVFSHARG